jgi:LmbE family N-acetylglucosaminyl deacetylase
MTSDATAQEQPKRAMLVMAHPDDAEFLCGGTIARLCAEGWDVTYVVATSGDKGTRDPQMTRAQLAAMREGEQSAAAEVLGVRACIYLRHPDGFLEESHALRGEVVHLLRVHRPNLVITWDGFRRGFNHRDHRTIGIVTYDAVFPAVRDPLYYPADAEAGLAAHRVPEMLLAGSDQPDHYVDISDHFETKLEAIYCHTSQIQTLPKEEFFTQRREQALESGRQSGIPFAEAFRRVTLR